MLAPAMIRVLRPDMRIVHFSHTPFPEFGSLARLPEAIASTLVNGMLGADLIGFQRAQWAHRFLHCCQQLGMHVDHEHGYVQHQGAGCGRAAIRCPWTSGRFPSGPTRPTYAGGRRTPSLLIGHCGSCESTGWIRRRTPCAGSRPTRCCCGGFQPSPTNFGSWPASSHPGNGYPSTGATRWPSGR